MNNQVPELFTQRQVAEYLQLTTRQVARMMNSGKLPTVRVHNDQLRVPLDDLRRWLDARKKSPPEDAEPVDWIDMQHAAELIDVPYALLRRMVEANLVPHSTMGTGDIRFHRPDLLRWLRSMEGHDD